MLTQHPTVLTVKPGVAIGCLDVVPGDECENLLISHVVYGQGCGWPVLGCDGVATAPGGPH